jgi:Pentapeptide repeats (8 copies)
MAKLRLLLPPVKARRDESVLGVCAHHFGFVRDTACARPARPESPGMRLLRPRPARPSEAYVKRTLIVRRPAKPEAHPAAEGRVIARGSLRGRARRSPTTDAARSWGWCVAQIRPGRLTGIVRPVSKTHGKMTRDQVQAILEAARVREEAPTFETRDLSGLDLSDLDFYRVTFGRHPAAIEPATLQRTSFRNGRFEQCSFAHADLELTDLRG